MPALSLALFALLISILSGCTSTDPNSLEGFAFRCGEQAYDAIFYGGNHYDYVERSTVSSIFRGEADGGGRLSESAYQGIVNEVGPDAAQPMVNEFDNCMDDAPAA